MTMRIMRTLALALALAGALPSIAAGQAQLEAGHFWGNDTAAKRPARAASGSAMFDRAFGSTALSMLYRHSSSGWIVLPAANLVAIAGLTSAADKCIHFSGSGAAAVFDCTSFGRSFLGSANASAGRTSLGVAIGSDVQAFDSDLSALAANATNGLWARTGSGTGSARTITGPAAGVSVSNGDGVSGNPTIALANDLAAIEALSSTGFAARTATDAWAQRTFQAGTGLSVANGDGVSGNPSYAINDAELLAIAGLTSAADTCFYFTGSGTAATFSCSSAIRTWLATPSSANLRSALSDESGSGAAYFQGGDLGTPSAGVATNLTGLPIAGIAGLGANVGTWFATPSSANLRSALTDETGTGPAVFGTNPTITGPTLDGGPNISQNFVTTGVITPTTLSGDVDNYSPTGLATAHVIRLDGGAANRNMTGIAAQAAGTKLVLLNIGATNNLVLKNETTSTAANRFALGADVTLTPGQSASLWYDTTSSRWRAESTYTAAGGAAAGTVTSVATSGCVTGGTITTSGTVTFDVGCVANYLSGLGTANNASDATNDIDIAVGVAADSTNAVIMKLGSALTKRLDAGWAAGTNQGMRDSGASISNTTYHIYLVAKANGADVDIYAHTSTTIATVITALQAETGGGSYIYARRIASIVRISGSIRNYVQVGDEFWWKAPSGDISATNPGTSAVLRTLTLPTGIKVQAFVAAGGAAGTSAAHNAGAILITDPDTTDTTPNFILANVQNYLSSTFVDNFMSFVRVWTNTSAQVRSRIQISNTATRLDMATFGWLDPRGRH